MSLSPSSPTSSGLISLLLELDIHLPADRNGLVVDHFNYDTVSAPDVHDVLLLPRPDSLRPGMANLFKGSGTGGEAIALPRAVGQSLGNSNPLLTPILRAPRTAYSYSPKDDLEGVDDPFGVGSQLSLITTMQARNSARFTVVGSSEFFEDNWFGAQVKRGVEFDGLRTDARPVGTSNQAFAKEVTGWTFKEIGVLKVGKIEHHLNEGHPNERPSNPKIYRVKNDVVRG